MECQAMHMLQNVIQHTQALLANEYATVINLMPQCPHPD